jgi:hypothetical protein
MGFKMDDKTEWPKVRSDFGYKYQNGFDELRGILTGKDKNECEWLNLDGEVLLLIDLENNSTEELTRKIRKTDQELALLTKWYHFFTDKLTEPILSKTDVSFYMKNYVSLLPELKRVEENKVQLSIAFSNAQISIIQRTTSEAKQFDSEFGELDLPPW